MRNILIYFAANFPKNNAFILLFFIISFPYLTVNGETTTKNSYTNESVIKSSVKVPVNIASWMDNELRKAKRKTLLTKDAFFTQDSARVVGYIAGYHAGLGFSTVKLDANNDLTQEDRPIVSKIDLTGRFMCTIAMNHPRIIQIHFGEEYMYLYLEPGQTLAISFDWKDCVRTNCFKKVKEANQVLLLQGPLARLNYELLAIRLKPIEYNHNLLIKKAPNVYLDGLDSILVDNMALVNRASATKKYLKKTVEILKNNALIDYGLCLLDYVSYNRNAEVLIPQSFHKKLQQVPLNDPSCIISNNFSRFINGFERCDALLKANKIDRTSNDTTVILSWAERHLKTWERKDSLLKSDFRLSNNFCYEVTKIRYLSFELEGRQKSEAYDYFYKLQEGIKHPFLKQEGFRILASRFGKESMTDKLTDGGLSVPGSTAKQPKWEPRSLPNGVDAGIFKKLMARHKGKYVFVDFWGVICAPCRSAINGDKVMREKYANNPDFDFVFITCKDWSPDKKVYDNYVKEQGLKHSYMISDDDFNYMMQLFRFNGVPHYVFIDPDGNVLDTDFSRFGFEDAIKWIQDK